MNLGHVPGPWYQARDVAEPQPVSADIIFCFAVAALPVHCAQQECADEGGVTACSSEEVLLRLASCCHGPLLRVCF